VFTTRQAKRVGLGPSRGVDAALNAATSLPNPRGATRDPTDGQAAARVGHGRACC
jgi:hypothetical protein